MKILSALAVVASLALASAAHAQTYGASVNYNAHANSAVASPFAIR